MRASAVSEDTINVNIDGFSKKSKLKSEYILKVDAETMPNEKHHSSKKKNPNPQNLPVVARRKHPKLRSLIVLILLFTLCFIVSVTIGYNIVFMLFEL